jgi:tetratricopeptide (TPR) repeat protein
MRHSPAVVVGCLGLVCLASLLGAQEPAKKGEAVKPPWQRLLPGEEEKKAAQLEDKLVALQEAGKFAEALKVAEALAQLRTKLQGADHWESLDARSEVEAIRRVLRASNEEQQSYSRTNALQGQVNALQARGRYREAQPLVEQLLALRKRVLGEDHADTATSYNAVAYNRYLQAQYHDAEVGYRRALALRRKLLGEDHPDTAESYNNVAMSLSAQGKPRDAEEGLRKALAIWRRVLGEEHEKTALSYNNLATNLAAQGKYAQAERYYIQALALCRKVLGDEHFLTATTYNNLAQNLADQGKFAQAEQSFRQALALFRKLLGEEHPSTATVYNNLAMNLDAQGKYLQAEQIHRRALAIRRIMLGEEHPETASSYSNLALSLQAQGKLAQAEQGFRQALAITRKTLGEEHPLTATGHDNVAHCLMAQGKHVEAEEGNRQALALRRKALGEEHPDTAASYNNLAHDLLSQGKSQEAEENDRKALALFRKLLGEEHPNTAASYYNLGLDHYAQGRYAEAEKLWRKAAESFAQNRLRFSSSGLERATKSSERSPLPSLAAVLARNGKPEAAWQRYEESLARGTWDDLSARLRRPAAERAEQNQLVSRIEYLSKLLETTSSTPQATEERSKRREGLLTQLRQSQQELATFTRRLEERYGPVAGQVYSRDKIQASLPADAALIGWLDMRGEAKEADPNGEHWAVLLRCTGAPVWVRLPGSGDKNAWTQDDTRLPITLRSALQSARGDWQPLAQRLRQQRLQPLGKHLQAGNGLPAVQRLIVLPSLALPGVPVEVFADGYTVSYAHSGTMHAYLHKQPTPTGKGLFALADPIFETPTDKDNAPALPPGGVLLTVVIPGGNAAQAGLRPNDVLLRYGDTELSGPADFKPQPESNDAAQRVPVVIWREGKTLSRPLAVRPGKLGIVLASRPAPEALKEQRRLDNRLASRGGDDWPRLPGTRCEAASLQRLFAKAPVQVLRDSDASEQQLTTLASKGELGQYRYLHLATHGEVDDRMPLRSALILSRDHLPDDKQRQELLLAGQPIPDGRLTAEEILQRWNLHCDLVTLSACQTALGKYERGEGFVGFAQALVLAGSKSVCLSLWKVDDAATALLMERFYQNLLGKREGLDKPLGKAAALAEAKTWLRNLSREEAVTRAARLSEGVERGKGRKVQPLLSAVAESAAKDAKPYPHPYYWAAFVLLGDAE